MTTLCLCLGLCLRLMRLKVFDMTRYPVLRILSHNDKHDMHIEHKNPSLEEIMMDFLPRRRDIYFLTIVIHRLLS